MVTSFQMDRWMDVQTQEQTGWCMEQRQYRSALMVAEGKNDTQKQLKMVNCTQGNTFSPLQIYLFIADSTTNICSNRNSIFPPSTWKPTLWWNRSKGRENRGISQHTKTGVPKRFCHNQPWRHLWNLGTCKKSKHQKKFCTKGLYCLLLLWI